MRPIVRRAMWAALTFVVLLAAVPFVIAGWLFEQLDHFDWRDS